MAKDSFTYITGTYMSNRGRIRQFKKDFAGRYANYRNKRR